MDSRFFIDILNLLTRIIYLCLTVPSCQEGVCFMMRCLIVGYLNFDRGTPIQDMQERMSAVHYRMVSALRGA